MSYYFGENEEVFTPVYDDGRTKQEFADECDVNKILKRAQKTGMLSHYDVHKSAYADYDEFDFLQAQLKLTRGVEIFEALPSEVRREFGNDPGAFFSFVNDPANEMDLKDLLPAIAEPGSYFPNPLVRREAQPAAGPSRISKSYPANFSSGPQWPPEFEVVMAPVKAPLVTTI